MSVFNKPDHKMTVNCCQTIFRSIPNDSACEVFSLEVPFECWHCQEHSAARLPCWWCVWCRCVSVGRMIPCRHNAQPVSRRCGRWTAQCWRWMCCLRSSSSQRHRSCLVCSCTKGPMSTQSCMSPLWLLKMMAASMGWHAKQEYFACYSMKRSSV